MAHQSEAACLIATGAMYRHRLGLRSNDGRTTFVGFKPGGFSIHHDDSPFFHFDLEGRWQRLVIEGVHYLKGLDGKMDRIDRVREGVELVLRRRAVPFAEANDMDAMVRADVLGLIEEIQAGRLQFVEPPKPAIALGRDTLLATLERISEWDSSAWFRHRERYLVTYGPLPFLPPEAQQAVVVQATLGHKHGRAFAGAHAFDHAERTEAEFIAHLEDVRTLLGRRFEQCRVAFLAGADALLQPPSLVAAYLKAINRVFPRQAEGPVRHTDPDDEGPHQLQGTLTFLDDFPPTGPTEADWRTFERNGLKRIALGIESGDPFVKGLYGKTWDERDLRAMVERRKSAGVAASVLVLTGAGGTEHAERHHEATVRLVNALDLDRLDFVFLLDDTEFTGEDGPKALRAAGLTPLTTEQGQAARARLKEALSETLAARRVKVLNYSLDKQWA